MTGVPLQGDPGSEAPAFAGHLAEPEYMITNDLPRHMAMQEYKAVNA